MILKKALALFLLLVIQVILYNKIDATLVYVQAIWRHGDRAPTKLPYPNDVHTEDKWDNGWGQLTKKGKHQMLKLGNWFKKRYVTRFVNSTYKSKEVFVMSSETDRTLESAQAFLFGMYPKNKNTGTKLPTQVVPIHCPNPADKDPLLRPNNFDCPEYYNKVKSINKNLYQELQTNYSDVFNTLYNETGHKKPLSIKELGKLCNVKIEMMHNLSQPSWVFREWQQYNNRTTLDIVCDVKVQHRLSEFRDSELGKLRGGYLLDYWMENTKKIVQHPNDPHKKMILYSSHAETVLALMSALDVFPNEIFTYGSAFIMELHKNKKGKYYVNFFVKPNDKPLQTINIPDCKLPCEVEKLEELVKSQEINSKRELFRECGIEYCQKTDGVVFDYAD